MSDWKYEELYLSKDVAFQVAKLFNFPARDPEVILTNENGRFFISYNSGMDYFKDGYQFEWDAEIVKPNNKPNPQD